LLTRLDGKFKERINDIRNE
jgi:hypothetical protein